MDYKINEVGFKRSGFRVMDYRMNEVGFKRSGFRVMDYRINEVGFKISGFRVIDYGINIKLIKYRDGFQVLMFRSLNAFGYLE